MVSAVIMDTVLLLSIPALVTRETLADLKSDWTYGVNVELIINTINTINKI